MSFPVVGDLDPEAYTVSVEPAEERRLACGPRSQLHLETGPTKGSHFCDTRSLLPRTSMSNPSNDFREKEG